MIGVNLRSKAPKRIRHWMLVPEVEFLRRKMSEELCDEITLHFWQCAY